MTDKGHWIRWHEGYEDPASSLSRRLSIVQKRLGHLLDQAPDGPIRLISLCAGQGRDVIGVMATHRRGGDVHGRLVELDRELADQARSAIDEAGLARSRSGREMHRTPLRTEVQFRPTS